MEFRFHRREATATTNADACATSLRPAAKPRGVFGVQWGPHSPNDLTDADFKNYAGGNYLPKTGGALVNAGTNELYASYAI